MFTKTKKILSGFLAFFAVLVIAGCQPKNLTKDPQDLTQDQQGTWKWTEKQLTMQKVFLASNLKKLQSALMLDDFEDVNMTLNIKDKKVELKYQFNYRKLYEDQYNAQGLKTPDFETYLKNKTADFKKYTESLQHTKITLDEANSSYEYSLTGEINTKNHTITFPETPTFLSRIIMGTGYDPLKPITYNYTVEGKQITLYAEEKDSNNLLHVMRLRFNYAEEKK